jgi:PAS domain S-box-containing protein
MVQPNPSDSLTQKYSVLRQSLIDMEMETSTLEFSEDLFKALFMGAPVGIYVLVGGRFTLANPQFQMDTGYPLGDLVGLDSLKLVVPPDRDRVRAEALAMIKGDRLFPYEFRTEFKTGGIRSVLGSVSKITYQGERAILGYYMDVTEQRRAHIALGASEARLRDLFDHAPVGYYEVDTDGRITEVNRTALDMLGYTESEMRGEFGWVFMVEPEQSKASLQAKMAGEIPPGKGFERTFITKYDAHMNMLMGNRLIYDQDGKITGLRSTFQDITEQKAMQRELGARQEENTRLEVLNEVAIAMAHHVRNAITPIIGMADLYDPANAETGDRLRETALSEGGHIAAIIDALMDISRSGEIPTVEYLGKGSARMLDMDALIEQYVQRYAARRVARQRSNRES